jgi:GT2 family glycosyltransferase
MLLSIITLNYKKSHLTLACMQSLQKQFPKEFKAGEIELIIVDNASGDDSVNILNAEIKKQNYKNTHVIANKTNAGFSAGCNLGAKHSKGKLLLFLNNDTNVPDQSLLAMAQYLSNHPDIAILGGQLRNLDGSKQPSAGKFYTPLNVTLLLTGMERFGLLEDSPSEIMEVEWVKGALFMIRSELFRELQVFDEKIFMYTEDMELCYRAKQAGYKVYFYPDVKVIHAEQGSSNRTFAIINIYQNLLYFYQKHRTHKEYLYIKSLLRTKAFVLLLAGRITGSNYLIQTYEKAFKLT